MRAVLKVSSVTEINMNSVPILMYMNILKERIEKKMCGGRLSQHFIHLKRREGGGGDTAATLEVTL